MILSKYGETLHAATRPGTMSTEAKSCQQILKALRKAEVNIITGSDIGAVVAVAVAAETLVQQILVKRYDDDVLEEAFEKKRKDPGFSKSKTVNLDKLGLGQLLGLLREATKVDQSDDPLTEKARKDLNNLTALRNATKHPRDNTREQSIDEAVRFLDEVVVPLAIDQGLLTEDEVRQAKRKARINCQNYLNGIEHLDRTRQRGQIKNDLVPQAGPRTLTPLMLLVIHGEKGQGHTVMGKVASRLVKEETKQRSQIEIEIQWPDVEGPSNRLAALFARIAEKLEIETPKPLPEDQDPLSSPGRAAWQEYLTELRSSIVSKASDAIYLRHFVRSPKNEDRAVLVNYLESLWLPLADELGHETTLILELALAKQEPGKMLKPAWWLALRQRGVLSRCLKWLDSCKRRDRVFVLLLEELRSVTEDDITTWLFKQSELDIETAKSKAKELFAESRDGRFELLVPLLTSSYSPNASQGRDPP